MPWRDDEQDRRERIVQVYKKGADHSTSRFQNGHEIWQKGFLSKLCPLPPKKRERIPSIRNRCKEGNWTGDISQSDEALR
jgi:hypothetical protein